MLDFTSALYLGLRHPHASLAPWAALTEGRPAVLGEADPSGPLARQLAELQGCEYGVLAPSSLHLFWDLFGLLVRENVRIYMDVCCYATLQWGAERAAAARVPLQLFPHQDADAVQSLVRRECHDGKAPIIVTDGYCPHCARLAPLADYAAIAERHGGYLVIDDTQALGVLGEAPSPRAPYGEGGGGSLRHLGLSSPRILVGSSLAKAFGAPVAVLAGSTKMIRRFQQQSETRVHCSPPSAAGLAAAQRALAENRLHGDRWRAYLIGLVNAFRTQLGKLGLQVSGGPFPVLTIRLSSSIEALALRMRLLQQQVCTVAVKSCDGVGAGVSFLITALHDPSDIAEAVAALGRITMAGHGPQLIAEYSHVRTL